MTLAYLILSAVIVYAGFCRLVKTDLSTHLLARFAFWLLTVSAVAGAAAAVVGAYVPQWPSVLTAAAVALTMLMSSSLWRDGVPGAYK